MKNILILFIVLIVTDVFSQPNIQNNEWKIFKEIRVPDGIVFREDDELYLIKPLITHYTENKIDYVGYSKARVVLFGTSRYSRLVSPEIIDLEENIYCNECYSLFQKETHQYDIAKKHTEFIELFDHSDEIKIYEVIKNLETAIGKISLSVRVGGFHNEINLFIDDGNSKKLFESAGSLMFYGTEDNLFYIGVNSWGGSGHTGFIYFWDIG